MVKFPLISVIISCRCVSTTIDPFWDISLDLGNIDHSNGRSSSGASAASTPDPTPPGKQLNSPLFYGSSACVQSLLLLGTMNEWQVAFTVKNKSIN